MNCSVQPWTVSCRRVCVQKCAVPKYGAAVWFVYNVEELKRLTQKCEHSLKIWKWFKGRYYIFTDGVGLMK